MNELDNYQTSISLFLQIQVDKETRNIAAGTDVTTRAKGNNTDTVLTRNVACDIGHIDKCSVQTQADGTFNLLESLLRDSLTRAT